MKVSNIILAGILSLSSVSYAECEPVTYLKQGQIVSCSGYLFSPEKEKEVREMAVKYPIQIELINKQEHLINKLNDQVQLNQQISANLRQQINHKDTESNLEKIIYFTLGTVIGIGVSKIVN